MKTAAPETPVNISEFDYELPDARIPKFPLPERDRSKLLIYRQGEIGERHFRDIGEFLPADGLLVFNNTKVIRARLIFHKQTGARIEIFCLEPHDPADYERAFSQTDQCIWQCMVGNLKKWKNEDLHIDFEVDGQPYRLTASKISGTADEPGREPAANGQLIRFRWNGDFTFGQLLETLGRIPIPPYLCRESEESDLTRYQTVYSKFEGSVAAPTAGLHFTRELLDKLTASGLGCEEVTLHVGAGTFMPVKTERVTEHAMHTEHFEITLPAIRNLIRQAGKIVAVGTTSVRTLESLNALGYRIVKDGTPRPETPVSQWENYAIPAEYPGTELLHALVNYMEKQGVEKLKTATQIMIMPGYRFRIVNRIITNFHQPKSTLLLLVSAFIGQDWKNVYDYALKNDFRFLSYGDSSILIP